jgi:alpha-beta hydrolase superfamily lysophospholipase
VAAPTRTDRPASRGNLAVHRWEGSATTHVVLLAHGISEHARRYDHVADALVAHGAAVYAPDHYGHGESEGERSSVDDVEVMVTDLAAVARLAQEDHPELPVVLLGHSLGGLIATRFAQRHEADLAGLALSAPFVGGNPAFAPLLDMDPMPEVPLDPTLLSRDESVGDAYVADPLVYSGPILEASLRGLFAAVAAVAAGPALDVPTLWLHGDADGLAPLGVTRDALGAIRPEQLEEHVYPGARHEIFNETNRDEVIGHLVDFVDRIVAARSVTNA